MRKYFCDKCKKETPNEGEELTFGTISGQLLFNSSEAGPKVELEHFDFCKDCFSQYKARRALLLAKYQEELNRELLRWAAEK